MSTKNAVVGPEERFEDVIQLFDDSLLPAIEEEIVTTEYVPNSEPDSFINHSSTRYAVSDTQNVRYKMSEVVDRRGKFKAISYTVDKSPKQQLFPISKKCKLNAGNDWKKLQNIKLDVLEIMDGLPAHLQDTCRRLFEKRGIVVNPVRNPLKKPPRKLNKFYTKPPQQNIKPIKKYDSSKKVEPKRLEKSNPLEIVKSNIGETKFIIPELRRQCLGIDDLNEIAAVKRNSIEEKRTCPCCSLRVRRSVYYHHARNIRHYGTCSLQTPLRFPCNMCSQRLGTLESLCVHMEQIHEAPTAIEVKYFDTEENFKKFRTELEGNGGNFRMARGNKKNKKGIVQYYRCNRTRTLAKKNTLKMSDIVQKMAEQGKKICKEIMDAEVEQFEENRESQNNTSRPGIGKQVLRTEQSCTAFFIKTCLPDGRIEVRFCGHHLHEDVLIRIPEAVRTRIFELVHKKVPLPVIPFIIKEERLLYCLPNSASEKRIKDMSLYDIRQVMSTLSRREKVVRTGGKLRGPVPEVFSNSAYDVEYLSTNAVLSERERKWILYFEENGDAINNVMDAVQEREISKKILYDKTVEQVMSIHNYFENYRIDRPKLERATLQNIKADIEELAKRFEVPDKNAAQPPVEAVKEQKKL